MCFNIEIVNLWKFGTRPEARNSTEVDILTMKIGASWRANKNICIKGKLGALHSGVGRMLRSWGTQVLPSLVPIYEIMYTGCQTLVLELGWRTLDMPCISIIC